MRRQRELLNMRPDKNTLGLAIIAVALLAEVPRFVVVNWRIEGVAQEPGLAIGLLVGLGMGVVMPAGTAYVFHAWRDERAGTRAWRLLLAFFVGFLLAEGIMLTPYVAAGIAGQAIVDVIGLGWWRGIWSVVTTLAPLGIVAGVAYAMQTGELAPSAHKSRERAGTVPAQPARMRAVPADEPAEQSILCPNASSGCNYAGKSIQAVNAHARFCQHKSNGRAVLPTDERRSA